PGHPPRRRGLPARAHGAEGGRSVKRILVAFAAVVAIVASLLAPSALAQDAESGSLRISAIDSRNSESVAMVVGWDGAPGQLESATIVENGVERRPASVAPLPGGLLATVLVIDTSEAMDAGGALVQAREADRKSVV